MFNSAVNSALLCRCIASFGSWGLVHSEPGILRKIPIAFEKGKIFPLRRFVKCLQKSCEKLAKNLPHPYALKPWNSVFFTVYPTFRYLPNVSFLMLTVNQLSKRKPEIMLRNLEAIRAKLWPWSRWTGRIFPFSPGRSSCPPEHNYNLIIT
jgi:hypothetical protein